VLRISAAGSRAPTPSRENRACWGPGSAHARNSPQVVKMKILREGRSGFRLRAPASHPITRKPRVLEPRLRSRPQFASSCENEDPSRRTLRISAAGSRFPTPSRENRACWGPGFAHARNSPQVFLILPQGSVILHSFCTMQRDFYLAARNNLPESGLQRKTQAFLSLPNDCGRSWQQPAILEGESPGTTSEMRASAAGCPGVAASSPIPAVVGAALRERL
jgi:hypothetical protein